MSAIASHGGMSMTNGYDVEFEFPKSSLSDTLKAYYTPDSSDRDMLKILCDEAQLPNVQSATGQLQGRYLGENQVNYPYAKFYSDISLSWMVDANATPIKIFTSWHNFIFNGAGKEKEKSISYQRLNTLKEQTASALQREVRMQYPTEYLATCRITKTEKGPSAPNERGSMMYILQDIYPYSLDTVPLSYGTSQITKFTVNFQYSKHTVVFNDIRKYEGVNLEGVSDLFS
jgi:hypothetical protein